jgi:hypothetical protein
MRRHNDSQISNGPAAVQKTTMKDFVILMKIGEFLLSYHLCRWGCLFWGFQNLEEVGSSCLCA